MQPHYCHDRGCYRIAATKFRNDRVQVMQKGGILSTILEVENDDYNMLVVSIQTNQNIVEYCYQKYKGH